MQEVLKLRPAHMGAMRQHVAGQAPVEACGLLAGKGELVKAVLRIHNVEQSPVHFRMDPRAQYNAFKWMDANSLDLVGIFHSHPSGPETVSATDIAEAAYEVVHVIWFPAGGVWKARGFWIERGQAKEVELQILAE